MNKAIFLDRDGTINVEKNYLYNTNDFEFIEMVPNAIRIFNSLGYKVIVLTNQSGIARGYYSENDLKKLHIFIDKELNKFGAKIDAYYYCPHNFENGIGKYKVHCNCRKPKTGMFKKAISDFKININESWMIGDKVSDIVPAESLKLNCGIVLTGYGKVEISKLTNNSIMIFDDLYGVAKYIKQVNKNSYL